MSTKYKTYKIEGEIVDNTFVVEIMETSEKKALEQFYSLQPTRPKVLEVRD